MTPVQDRSHDGTRESDRSRSREQREQTLEVIRSRPRPLSLSELAEVIADREPSEWTSPPENLEDETRVRIRLHHVDLPMLQDEGAIEYDPSRRLVL